ncbi:uncharacterized protein LOC103580499 isoform X2 [Microplitis demolitor]|uniref:uncharacterized protein LOC103580499 isoform X2 n=1 Tax=Microplitis demolitor TaxID=69319 RepID=UPI0006D4D67F|nr:uncharacterized protein LOC103580499 isoform X2 [Microplitis demolitor]
MESEILSDDSQSNFDIIQQQLHNNKQISLLVKLKNWVLKNFSVLKKEVVNELLMILREEGYPDIPCNIENLITLKFSINSASSLTKKVNKPNSSIINPEDYQNNSIFIKNEWSESWINDQVDEFDSNKSHDKKTDYDQLVLNGEKIQTDPFIDASPDFSENMSDSRDQLSDKDCIHSLSDRATSEKNENEINLDTENSKLYTLIKGDLLKMETRWSQKLESTKRSLMCDIVRKYEDLRNSLNSSSRALGTSLIDDKEILGVKLPFHTVKSFREFDESIGDNPEKEIAMKSLMTNLCFGASHVSASIGCILSAFLTRDLQMQYSACGKKIRGVNKLNFGDTYTFQYVKVYFHWILQANKHLFHGKNDFHNGHK